MADLERGDAGFFGIAPLQLGFAFSTAAVVGLTTTLPMGQGVLISRGWVVGRAVIDQKPINIHDLAAQPAEHVGMEPAYQPAIGLVAGDQRRAVAAAPWRVEPCDGKEQGFSGIARRLQEAAGLQERQVALAATEPQVVDVQPADARQQVRILGGIEIDPRYFRPTEVDLLLGDPRKARKVLGWKHKTDFKTMVREMVTADLKTVAEEATRFDRRD